MYGFCRKILKSVRGLGARALAPAGILSYMAVRDRGCYDILTCDHIGDFLYTAGYLSAFKQANRIRRLRVIGTERLEKLARFYPGAIDEYRAVSRARLQLMLYAYRIGIGRRYFRAAGCVTVIEPSGDFVRQFEYVETFPNLTLRDCIQYGILRLPETARMERPDQTLCRAAAGEGGGERIMLCPAAVVTEWKSCREMFDKLAETLSRSGCRVYENKESVPLDECVRLMCRMDCVIGMRSGLLDLAALAGCPVIALYPPENRMMRYFDLGRMNEHNPGIAQYQLSGETERDIRQILAIARAVEGKTDGD